MSGIFKLIALSALVGSLIACDRAKSNFESTEVGDPGPVPIAQLSAATPATLMGACADLAINLGGLTDTEITGSSEVEEGVLSVAGNPIGKHCLVTGKMFERVSPVDTKTYAIGFEMRLPIDWNGRFYYQANGGTDGRVSTATGGAGPGDITNALNMGFAVLSSDAGHQGSAQFGIDPQARLDFGYQAVQKLTPMAKELVSIAYGKAPDRSYFGGCSNGGRHTFQAFDRMPDEYDGYLAGAPGFRLPLAALAQAFGVQRYATIATDPDDISTGFTQEERTTVVNSALAVCDNLDGVVDGIVSDNPACQSAFSLDDVPTCTGVRDGTCLSAAQKEAIAPIFSGAETSEGVSFYAPFPFDTGIETGGYARFEFVLSVTRNPFALGYIWLVPPEDPVILEGNIDDFVFNGSVDDWLERINATDETYTETALSFMTPPSPDELSSIRDRGAKIMVYHGYSDPVFSPLDTADWYDSLTENHGGDATDFARLYLVPGMGHCSGGAAVDQADMLTPLVQWVEQGVDPSGIISTARGDGNPARVNGDLPSDWAADRTRPLCEYPEVARYNGEGNIEEASSFLCEL